MVKKILIAFAIGIFIGGLVGEKTAERNFVDGNTKLEYGDSGFPKNCRAIIKSNIDGVRLGTYSTEEALSSIDRNCGEFGYSWSD